MGPVDLAAGAGFDIPPHPHIGLSTVTYLLDGENIHRDSLGTVQRNVPGDLNLMTAGRGVVHSERADPAWRERGGTLHGIQIWLALPAANEDDAPSFEHHPAATLPEIPLADGARARILLGDAYSARSPVVHPSEPLLVDVTLDPDPASGSDIGAELKLELPDAPERAIFVIDGKVSLDGAPLVTNQMAILHASVTACCRATSPTRLLILGGPSPGERFIEWNFVASSKARIDSARDAWRAQTFPKIPGDDQEFVPY